MEIIFLYIQKCLRACKLQSNLSTTIINKKPKMISSCYGRMVQFFNWPLWVMNSGHYLVKLSAVWAT
jgi:hypothetical protein